ncbi:hypothetical protein GQX73_g7168 [Xylaria multiplex]|uniref:Uncharacterized protein n=1 Tax=Xylaria multiplex TaxID=323545 RepID=A0A7C8MPN6_9PEZI|nr:hypothetical protein GQX73_g7168 [Xylaria multiplex]
MADDAHDAHFQSIAEAATASWYAHRASTPNSRHSSLLRQEGSTQNQISTSTITASAPQSTHPLADATSASMGSKTLLSSSSSSTTTTPISSHRDSEAQALEDMDIHSDIPAWESALRSLPAEFANVQVPVHPLAQALMQQPTLRPAEWNQYRQQGGFVPRTAHDYSSLMIYISGQVNPNPCRNCLLRNGPFARCVVSPPAVLAINKARIEMLRPFVKSTNPTPRQTIPRKPKSSSRSRRDDKRKRLELERQQHEEQQRRRLEEPRDVPITQSPAALGAGPGGNLTSFDEKLRYIRASSPRSRRRLAAETLQWQAAIATIEAEGLPPTPNLPVIPINGASFNHNLHTPLSSYTPLGPVATQSAATAVPFPPVSPLAEARIINHGVRNTHEAMDEDGSEDGHEDTASIIKAPM